MQDDEKREREREHCLHHQEGLNRKTNKKITRERRTIKNQTTKILFSAAEKKMRKESEKTEVESPLPT